MNRRSLAAIGLLIGLLCGGAGCASRTPFARDSCQDGCCICEASPCSDKCSDGACVWVDAHHKGNNKSLRPGETWRIPHPNGDGCVKNDDISSFKIKDVQWIKLCTDYDASGNPVGCQTWTGDMDQLPAPYNDNVSYVEVGPKK